MASKSYSCIFFFVILITLVSLQAIAREIPISKNIEHPKDVNKTTTLVNENNAEATPTEKDVPDGDQINNDNKNFVKFGGIGAAGGIGGVAGIVPIDFLGKGLGGGLPMPMLPLPGGGLGGIGGGTGTGGGIGGGTGAGGGIGGGNGGGIGGGGAGGGGPGCPTPTSKGGFVTIP